MARSSSPPRSSRSPSTPSCPGRTCPRRSPWPAGTCPRHAATGVRDSRRSPCRCPSRDRPALGPLAHCHFSSSTSASGSESAGRKVSANLGLRLAQRHLAQPRPRPSPLSRRFNGSSSQTHSPSPGRRCPCYRRRRPRSWACLEREQHAVVAEILKSAASSPSSDHSIGSSSCVHRAEGGTGSVAVLDRSLILPLIMSTMVTTVGSSSLSDVRSSR